MTNPFKNYDGVDRHTQASGVNFVQITTQEIRWWFQSYNFITLRAQFLVHLNVTRHTYTVTKNVINV